MLRYARNDVLLGGLLLLAACSKSDSGNTTATAPAPVANVVVPPSAPQDTSDPLRFVPLRSQAVKDAIHSALVTGQTQRWQDGALSGYAVPSQTPGANGCRAVRYTVDQRPNGNFETITACDASR